MRDALQSARSYLVRERALGLEWIDERPRESVSNVNTASDAAAAPSEPQAAPRTAPPRTAPRVERPSSSPASAEPPAAPSRADRDSSLSELLVEPGIRAAASLDALREVLGDCQRCKLSGGRTNIVYGVGDPGARLMFVGEGPGEDEDRQGVPFVGKAGRLLTDIIEKGIGIARDEVYIANVVKCRPPNNRNPQPDEIVACEPFLARQVELVGPEVLVTLGTFATQALLGNRIPISRQRGTWTEFRGVAVMPTFHPAYLLRSPSEKRVVWGDIQMVMERLGIARPKRGG